jgi:hypothetical protein
MIEYKSEKEQKEEWCGNCGFKQSSDCNDEITWKRCRLMNAPPEERNIEARLKLARETAREKMLDEVICKWSWWFDEGFERPIQKLTVIKLFESIRGNDEDE